MSDVLHEEKGYVGDALKVPQFTYHDVTRMLDQHRAETLEAAVKVVMSLVEFPPDHLPDLSLNDAWDLGLMTAAANIRALVPETPRMELVIRGEVVEPPKDAYPPDEMITVEFNPNAPRETVVAELKVKHVLSGFHPVKEGLIEEINIDHLADKLDQLQVYFGPDDDRVGSYPLTEVGEMILKEKYGINLNPELDWFLETYTEDDDDWDDNVVEYDCVTCPFCNCVCNVPKREPLSFCEAIVEFFQDLKRVFFGP